MVDKGILREIASRYKGGETIRELIDATGYSQRRVRTAIAKSGVPFRWDKTIAAKLQKQELQTVIPSLSVAALKG